MMLDLKTLTQEQKDAFIAGWEAAGGYTGDYDAPYTWAAPWDWLESIDVTGDTLEAMGADWWRRNRAEIEALLAEEEEARAEVEDE